MKKFRVLFLYAILLLLLVGCGDKDLIQKEDMVSVIENYIPNVSFTSLEHKDVENSEFGQNYYTFTNSDFSFQIFNYMTKDMFSITKNRVYTDYLYQLIHFKEAELIKLAEKNGIIYLLDGSHDDIRTLLSNNRDRSVVLVKLGDITSYNSNVDLEIYLNDYSHIENVFTYLHSFYDILRSYYPNSVGTEDYLELKLSYLLYGKTAIQDIERMNFTKFYGNTFSLYNREWPMEANELDWVQLDYAYQVRTEKVIDGTMSYNDSLMCMPIELNRLSVDGLLFECTPGFGFVYNIEEDDYYGIVYGGKATSTGIDTPTGYNKLEGQQKAFLDFVYGDVNYIVNEEKDYSVYTINGVEYKIVSNSNNLDFYKDGKIMDINDFDTIPYNSTYSVSQYISLDDFAELFCLSVDSIDLTNGVIYFSKLSK